MQRYENILIFFQKKDVKDPKNGKRCKMAIVSGFSTY
jgi:hypothetical protein